MNLRDMVHRTGKIVLSCIVGLGFFLPATTVVYASTGTWTRNTLPSGSLSLNSIAYGAGLWVAAQNNGDIVTSTDGVSWTSGPTQIDGPGFTQLFDSIVYGSEFVIVGQNGEIDTSINGTSWTNRASGTTNELYSVTYGNGTYVAVGFNGTVETSSDGVTWTNRTVSSAGFEAVTYGNNQFVAACDHGTVYTSPDGVTWTSHSAGVSADLYAVTYGNGTFVAVGTSGGLATSTDGATWHSATSGTTSELDGVAYGAGKFVAVGSSSTTTLTMISSANGTSWNAETLPPPGSQDFLDCITYANSRFVAGGQDYGATQGIVYTQSTNADLSGLLLNQGTLVPSFSPGNTSYSDNVAYNVASVNVTPTAANSTSTLTLNGSTTTSGTTVSMPLNVGLNTVTVVVTAQDGTTKKTYTVAVTRAPASTNANLSGLTLSSGTLTPTFASGTFSYTANVSNSVSSVNVTPTVADATATVKVNGIATTSGVASAPVSLSVGSNTITVVVTAQDGTTTQAYTVTVTRAASSNANLSNLTLSQGTLSPAFATGTTGYTANVPYGTSSVNVTPTVADSGATLTVNGTPATSGSPSSVVLTVGSNTIAVVVTAPDGTTKQTYKVTVTRAPASTNANLSSLTLDQGTLSPTFATGTFSYTANVPNSASSVNVTPTVADPTATVTVNGAAATSGSPSLVSLNVGSNTITVVVTAQDGTTTQTYTVTVTRAASSNANLSNLTLSQGTLSPAFASATTTYTANVPYGTSSVNVTPTVADSGATLTVNGTPATSGSPSSVTLSVGSNAIAVVVTAQDGTTTQTYTVTVTRATASTDANLSSLTLDQGSLTPVFASGTFSYAANVPNSAASVNVTPTVADPTATVTVNGTAATSGSAASILLNVGSNTITVVVTAQDGTTTQTYTVAVTRAPSSNANLNNLALSSGSLSPTFASGTLSYTAGVGNGVTSVNVTPTVADSTATVQVNGTPTTSGVASAPVNLNVGSNTITVVVTAQDGTTTQTYTITVTRAPSSNADLSNLTLSQGTLTPAFDAGTKAYTAGVGNGVTSVNVTPTLADSTATVQVNGTPTTSGVASAPVNLNVGSNTITVVVTAQDGTTTQTYTITVTRAPSSNADLSNLTLSQGTLTPAFAAGTTAYTAGVGNGVTSVNVTPTVADSTASVTVNGTTTTSGVASAPVTLNVGSNTITVVVTAQDGTTKQTYTVTVTRAPSSNADLSNLTLSQGTLTPTFAAGTTAYTAGVGNGVTSVNVTPTVADSTATVRVDGTSVASGSPAAVSLKVGNNTIKVVVTAQDGTTKQTYTVTVTRAPSSNADLSNLTLSQGTLTPAFAAGTTAYTASVPNSVISVNVTPTVADTTATVTVDGMPTTSGGASAAVRLKVGNNTIKVVVSAQDGTTTQTYTITVTRAPSSNADLSSLTLSQGTLTPTFAASTTAYTASVPYGTSSVTVTPTVVDSTSTMTVNGSTATSGSAALVPLNVGSNTITVVVTAQDGTTKQTYTITVTRVAASINADLSGLTLDHGTLSPTFASVTTAYTASVSYGTSSVDVTPTVANGTATMTVNGSPATSGGPASVNLNVGSNTITVVVTAQDGTTKQAYTITVTRAGAPSGGDGGSGSGGGTGSQLTWMTTWLPAWVTGQSVSQALTVTGGILPYTWSVVSGALPDGVTLSTTSGVLQGKVSHPGQGQVVIQVTDAKGLTVQQTLRWDILKPYEREIVLNGHGTNVPGLARSDGRISTTYMPIWYVMQMLKSLGVSSSWDGHIWKMTVNGIGNIQVGSPGRGDTSIYLNGVLLERVTRVVARDPNTNKATTYIPIWYVMQALDPLHLHSVWTGTTWVITAGQ